MAITGYNESSVLSLQAGVNYSISGFPDKDVYKTTLSSLDAIKLFPKSKHTVPGTSNLGFTSRLIRHCNPPTPRFLLNS